MILESVAAFAAINIVFEFVVIAMIPPKLRLRLLGSRVWSRVLHICILGGVLTVHWGTLIGTMSGFLSFCLSMVTVEITKLVFGYITPDEKFHRRIIGYTADELRWENAAEEAKREPKPSQMSTNIALAQATAKYEAALAQAKIDRAKTEQLMALIKAM